jgi:hypothetical protein
MKSYHIKVITETNNSSYVIQAQSISISSAGLYEFVNYPDGKGEVVAYFPISRTIIYKIEDITE